MPAMEGMRHKTLQEASKGGRIPSGESKRPRKKVRGLMRLKMGSTYVVKGNQMLLGVWVWNDTLFCGVVVVLSDGYSFFFERELDLRTETISRLVLKGFLSSEVQTNYSIPLLLHPRLRVHPHPPSRLQQIHLFFSNKSHERECKRGNAALALVVAWGILWGTGRRPQPYGGDMGSGRCNANPLPGREGVFGFFFVCNGRRTCRTVRLYREMRY